MLAPNELEPIVLSGGFRATPAAELATIPLGPMLDPLELLRLAGVPARVDLALLALSGLFAGELCADNDDVTCELPPPSPLDELKGEDFGRNGTFLTVLVETALLREERDERRLVRELLRSTSNCCLDAPDELASGDSDFLIEFVLRGNKFLLTSEGGVPLKDLLRSSAV